MRSLTSTICNTEMDDPLIVLEGIGEGAEFTPEQLLETAEFLKAEAYKAAFSRFEERVKKLKQIKVIR